MAVDMRAFECKCGCGLNNMDARVVGLVGEIQRVTPECNVTSGSRCPAHNESEGGKADSPHLRGLAADLYCPNSKLRYLVLRKLFALGIKRIGIGKDFIHLDIDPERTSWVGWLY